MRCPDCITKAGLLPLKPEEPRYKVVKILPPQPKEPEPSFPNSPHLAWAASMKERYGLDHLTVEEVREKWEEYSDGYCAGWLIDDQKSVEVAFGVVLEKI